MKPPTKDEIQDLLAGIHASEGLGEPDEVMVDAITHALGALELSIMDMPDSARITIVTLATLAFTYGQNATAMRLAAWLDDAGPATAQCGSGVPSGNRPAPWVTEYLSEPRAESAGAWMIAQIRAMREGTRSFPPMPATPSKTPTQEIERT